MIVSRRYVISGRVQGVGFRFFLQEAAYREGVLGQARNRPDRSVEVVAEGDAEAISRFERALYQGPPIARVERVDTEALPPSGRFTSFSIRG
jgi:acylphosphatase